MSDASDPSAKIIHRLIVMVMPENQLPESLVGEMMIMETFGFSAFVKLLSLNNRPQATAIKQRLAPTSPGGYDFHKQMRQLARRYLAGKEPLSALLEAAGAITNPAEARSAIAALERIKTSRAASLGQIHDYAPAIFYSPGGMFRVRFEPTFALQIDGHLSPIVIWNTMKPRLAEGPTYAALSIAAEAYERQGDAAPNIGLLSLQDPVRLYRLTDHPRQRALATTLVGRIEEALRNPQQPSVPRPEDRPIA